MSGSIDLLTALDLLGKAEARVAELEQSRNEADDQIRRFQDLHYKAELEARDLRARVAELEAALEKIAGAPQPRLGAMGANSMRHTARVALAAVRQEDEERDALDAAGNTYDPQDGGW